jgi:hypothetical protein
MKKENNKIKIRLANPKEIKSLKKLSTEKLIIWIIGKSREKREILSSEDIVIECWLINPIKHSLRGYSQFPDSNTVKKRIGDMKGKKGLLIGSEMSGYHLTEISKSIYADLKELIRIDKVIEIKGYSAADRNISSIDEAPYKRLKKTPAYIKYKDNRIDEIVETDFLYFYGINWHSKESFINNRLKNTDAVVKCFSEKDYLLKEVHALLNNKFDYIKKKLLEN